MLEAPSGAASQPAVLGSPSPSTLYTQLGTLLLLSTTLHSRPSLSPHYSLSPHLTSPNVTSHPATWRDPELRCPCGAPALRLTSPHPARPCGAPCGAGYAVLAVTPDGFALDREVGAGVEPWPMLRVPMQQVHSWLSIGGHFVLRHHGTAAPRARRPSRARRQTPLIPAVHATSPVMAAPGAKRPSSRPHLPPHLFCTSPICSYS